MNGFFRPLLLRVSLKKRLIATKEKENENESIFWMRFCIYRCLNHEPKSAHILHYSALVKEHSEID